MKVLVIGSGGREHAIAYALNKSQKVDEIHAIPGNPGMAEIGTCHPGHVEDLDSILKLPKNIYYKNKFIVTSYNLGVIDNNIFKIGLRSSDDSSKNKVLKKTHKV